jgi:hypothetical protein
MKYIFIFIFICAANQSEAQKYILLDKAMSQPAFYTNQLSVSEKFKGFFPLEKKELPKFIGVLEEIATRLSSKEIRGKAIQYQMGCTKFTGEAFPLARGERLDYVITSNCDGVKVSMHLVDAKINNENNAYFVKTWIKYIKNAVKIANAKSSKTRNTVKS